jgi:undecaprenyl-diphosphatase
MIEWLIELDRELFLFLNGLHTAWLDPVMYHISQKLTWLPLYALLLFMVWRRSGWKGLLYFAVLVGILVLLTDQGSVFLKKSVMRPRPCHEPALQGLVHLVRDHCGGRFGFVSSHAANTFGLAVYAIGVLRNRFPVMTPVMLAYATLNAYSRIYLGVHYPGDVLFGALLGAVAGWGVLLVWRRLAARSVT